MKKTIDGPCLRCHGSGREMVHTNLVQMGVFLGCALIAIVTAAALLNPFAFGAGISMFIFAAITKVYLPCTGCDATGRQTTIETREG